MPEDAYHAWLISIDKHGQEQQEEELKRGLIINNTVR